MSSPKIGRAYEKASNALAFQARKLREEAESIEAHEADATEDVDATVDRLIALAAEHQDEEAAKRREKAAEVRAQYRPLIERAERVLAENTAAIAELGPFVRRLGDLDWKAIRARARNTGAVGSLHSTHTNLGLLQRAVEEAMGLLQGNERDLTRWLNEVKSFTGYEEETSTYDSQNSRQYAANGLRGVMADRATPLRSKVAAIRKLLALVAADLDATDAALVKEEN
jgi:hypothetical protein